VERHRNINTIWGANPSPRRTKKQTDSKKRRHHNNIDSFTLLLQFHEALSPIPTLRQHGVVSNGPFGGAPVVHVQQNPDHGLSNGFAPDGVKQSRYFPCGYHQASAIQNGLVHIPHDATWKASVEF
jgi:hypothetical protein